MAEITQEEFKEKYADVRVKFASYYKYSFTYIGYAENGTMISVDYGGDAGLIYRFEISADDSFVLGETAKTLRSGVAVLNGEEIDEFWEI